MISIPVLNTYNLNQVLLVINLFPPDGQECGTDDELTQQAEALATRFEVVLKDRCVRFANRLGIRMGKIKTRSSERLYRSLARVVQEATDAARVEIYVDKIYGPNMERRITLGRDRVEADARLPVDDFATRCRQSNRELLTISLPECVDSVPEPRATVGHSRPSGVFVPLRDLTGQAKGVICCLNASKPTVPEKHRAFTYEDVAEIEAIGQAFVPLFEILLADQVRMDSMDKLAQRASCTRGSLSSGSRTDSKRVSDQPVRVPARSF